MLKLFRKRLKIFDYFYTTIIFNYHTNSLAVFEYFFSDFSCNYLKRINFFFETFFYLYYIF